MILEQGESIALPTESDLIDALKNTENEIPAVGCEKQVLRINELCATLWILPNGQKTWYLGYCKKSGKMMYL